jgi:AcrR family transcriptional regulator
VSSLTPPSDARAALLEAARAELVEHGPGAVGLRAVARRAGLSHGAPGYFFGDRAGMLTALATQGFVELAEVLERDARTPERTRLARLGDAYVTYGLANAALYDLMFHRDAVHPDDPDLQAAKARALEPLLRATAPEAAGGTPVDAMMSWALVHGLVTLVREGALPVGESALVPTLHAITARLAEHLNGETNDRPPSTE